MGASCATMKRKQCNADVTTQTIQVVRQPGRKLLTGLYYRNYDNHRKGHDETLTAASHGLHSAETRET
jgi:hypothetical protein